MSDNDDWYDYDGFDYANTYGTADDLAEHALPSPVWTCYDPDYDIESPTTDCEDYAFDEYYNEGTGVTGKKSREHLEGANDVDIAAWVERQCKRSKLSETGAIPDLKLPGPRGAVLEPTVVWMSRNEQLCPSPMQEAIPHSQGKRVALLEDWREKFKIQPLERSNLQKSPDYTEIEPCVLTGVSEIRDRVLESFDGPMILPPLSLTNADDLKSSANDSDDRKQETNVSPSPAVLVPGDELPSMSRRKRKTAELDTENAEDAISNKRRFCKLNISRLTEPARESYGLLK